MADDFARLIAQVASLDLEDAASLRRHLSLVEVLLPQSLPKQQLKASVSSLSPEQRSEFTALCTGLLFKNAVDLESFFVNVVAGSSSAIDCIPALLWVLLAGDTKRFIEPLATVLYYALKEGSGKSVRVPLGSEDRESIMLALIKAYGNHSGERLKESKEVMYELMARLNSGLPQRPSLSDCKVHPDLSNAVVNAGLFAVLRLRPEPERLHSVLEGIEAYALRRMFADTLLTIQAVRTILTAPA